MSAVTNFLGDFLNNIYRPSVEFSDIAEIIIIAFFLYHIILWMKNSRAWTLLKGILVIIIFALIAYVCKFTTILWIAGKTINVALIAVVVIFQPELRNALEQLGRKKILSSLTFDNQKSKNERYSAESIEAVIKAVYDMARVKTGALIVVEKEIQCREYERTGIPIGAKISSQLLVNIFEHNTPLHDGAVILRDNRIVSATCYLPLSNNLAVSKELGTRHRAGLGISEVSDSLTIIVSEETGFVSLACDGKLYRKVDADTLMIRLQEAAKRNPDEGKMKWWKGRKKDEKETDQ